MLLGYSFADLGAIFAMQGFAGLVLFSVFVLMALGLAIDLVDRQLLRFHRSGLADRHSAGDGMKNADRDGVVSDGEASRVDDGGRRRIGVGDARQQTECRQRRHSLKQPTPGCGGG